LTFYLKNYGLNLLSQTFMLLLNILMTWNFLISWNFNDSFIQMFNNLLGIIFILMILTIQEFKVDLFSFYIKRIRRRFTNLWSYEFFGISAGCIFTAYKVPNNFSLTTVLPVCDKNEYTAVWSHVTLNNARIAN